MAAAFAVALGLMAGGAPAQAFNERTLDLFFTHTGESLKITYKRNGRYIPSALKDLNRFLRDWRRNESIDMDPELFDLLWEIQQGVGKKRQIHVVSGYRSPATNNMLRQRSRGVAKFSQHMRGKACDFFIPGVSTSDIRKAAFKMQIGGVGYYPTSRTPFVHLDTGSVRSWPRMTRGQLLALFPDGKTVHLPSDGKPLKGYEVAKAELAARDRRSSTQVASARTGGGLGSLFGGGGGAAGGDRSRETRVKPEPGSGSNIIAALLKRDDDDVEDTVERQVSAEERGAPSRPSSSSLPGVNLTAPTADTPPAIATRAAPTPTPTPAPATTTATASVTAPAAAPPVPTIRPEFASPAAPAVPLPSPESEPTATPTPEQVLVASLPRPRPSVGPTTAAAVASSEVAGGTSAEAEAAVASLRASLDARSGTESELPVFGYADGGTPDASADNVLSATAAIVGPDTARAKSVPTSLTAGLADGDGSGELDPTATFFGPPDRSDSRLLIAESSMRTMDFAWLSHPRQGELEIVTVHHARMGGTGRLADEVSGWRTDRFEGIPHLYITQAMATVQ
ncbi:DUF882 domain-containing protein [Amorphus sp. 3PC139-8]|uniref:DUF882 domain-containing protein n=1 Tax=Amorphus sp. 3PC139-8 TaxID=2735676 RepID=UPI00345D7DBA